MSTDHLRMAGTYIATTLQLLQIINHTEELSDEFDFQNVLSDSIVRRLDPTGQHVISIRFGEWSNHSGEFLSDQVWRGEVKMGTPVTCEALLKLKGRTAAQNATFDVMIADLLELEPVYDYQPKVAHDGETQNG